MPFHEGTLVVQQYKKSGDLPSEALSHIYQNLKKRIFKKVGLKEEDISQEEFAKGNEEVTSHTIVSMGNENELSSVKKVNQLVSEFEELIARSSKPTPTVASPLEKVVSSLQKELEALKELEYKFAAPTKPSGFFSYFTTSSWEKSNELMNIKRNEYKRQITEVEDLLKKTKAALSEKSNLDETDLKLFEVNASRAIKGTISYVSWAIDGQKVDPISQKIYESWMNGTKPAYTYKK